MGQSLISSTTFSQSLRHCQIPKSVLPLIQQNLLLPLNFTRGYCSFRSLEHGFPRIIPCATTPTRRFCTKSLLSEIPNEKRYSKVGAESTGPIPSKQLLEVVENAAKTGAEVVMDAVNKPRNINYKGLTDLVTDTDKMSEAAILGVLRKNFEEHLILGEEGGLIGDTSSDYLWCIDPLDGTTNFAHGYPSFAVSVGVLFRGKPAAAAVVEFVGGPMCWNTRIFSASAGGGAFCNGKKIHVSHTEKVEHSLLVTGFGYEHDDAWATNMDLFKEFTDVSRGVRRLGAAAVDMCHVALGIVESYWEYRLKPWDMAAGVLMVEEAGGAVTRMDGGKFCVFDRSVLVSNGLLHAKLLERIGPATEKLKNKGIDFSLWFKPENYSTDF
ncbi:PREDICTED: phosphatase IMPL1, chloroplastic [Nelumbo nucifera]|uniref:Inositol-1-monophosphatase n=1 Tax=Nelumbo nucifera TaxID=4432 RepID=A0A1U8B927_NELNU|nr:PREDICTED: phosphatase IMPL1, chloroplastic [Nelumbo nucifera]